MKAILRTAYGPPDVLQLRDVPVPEPQGNQVLVRVRAASVNAGDYRGLRGRPVLARLLTGGLLKPKDPRVGSDLAGVVEALGPAADLLHPGDVVFGVGRGAFAEYALAREVNLVPMPAGISFEQAAAVPVAGLTALQGLRDAAGLRAGQQVLIQGASGGVGMFAVQLAKHFGAEVTAVTSPRNLDLARRLGADHVIDYSREDFTRSGRRYDLVFSVNGYHSLPAYRRALKPEGAYVCAGGTIAQFLQAMLFGRWFSRKGGPRMGSMGIARVITADLALLAGLLGAGAIAPVIDRTYPLDETADAVRYIEDRHTQGKVVIAVAT